MTSALLFFGVAVLASACGARLPAPLGSKPDLADAPLPPLENDPPPLIAPAARANASSSPVVFDAPRGVVWTANGDVGSISYVDPIAGAVDEVHIGQDVRSVALSPDGRWVAAVDRGAGTVTLLDAGTRTPMRTLNVGSHPRAAVWDSWDPRWLYVAIEDSGTVAVIDRTLGTLVRQLPVGRIPVALGVSKERRELAVLHRIDASVTLTSLYGAYSPGDQDAAPVDVSLADSPADADPKVAQGHPFAFESIAWAQDGDIAWLPHELLASREPFQFQETVFPAVSVVDLAMRSEVHDDPEAVIGGTFAGRKTIFAGITLVDGTGNNMVISQPCAASLHPNGLVGYVLACGSEDLLTFDMTTGTAVDIYRNLPGDHPMGFTLDDKGQRAFVVADQSHTLITLDLGGGSPIAHVSVVGNPISLVAKDPVDPELRAGLTLFYRANSAKGALATTGNNWMSCAACHLDGFTSTNEEFFETLHPADPRADARIGHQGLVDMFSTAPTPADPSFNPHDVLSAFLDQGGLAPDRTGAKRDGAINPSAPTADARTMAEEVARVVARDLPVGPSWLSPAGAAPDADQDDAWCGKCHAAEYAAWQSSAHAHAAIDSMVRFGAGVEQAARGPQYSRLCAGCHDPVSARRGDSSLTSGRGVTCRGCHDVSRPISAGGNADLTTQTYDWTEDHKARATADLITLRNPAFCGGCHQQFVPGDGLTAITTFTEWQSRFQATPCVDCHMPKVNGVADHSAPGGNVYLATHYGETTFANQVMSKVQSAISLTAQRTTAGVAVTLRNGGAGHAFPTGVTDIREPWVDLEAVDAQGKTIQTYGSPTDDAGRLGMDIADANGKLLLLHQLSEAVNIPFSRVVPPLGTLTLTLPLPPPLPANAVELDAVLHYHNVRTTYFQAATGDTSATAPDIVVARGRVQ